MKRYRVKKEYYTGIPYANEEAVLSVGKELTLCLFRGEEFYIPTWRYNYLFWEGKPFLNYEIPIKKEVVENNPEYFEEIK